MSGTDPGQAFQEPTDHELAAFVAPAVRAALERFGGQPVRAIPFTERQVGIEDANSRGEVWCWPRHKRCWELRIAERGDTHFMPYWAMPDPDRR